MINVVYEGNSDFFVFISKPNSEECSRVEVLDELLHIIAGELALFASCVEGDTNEVYLDMVNSLLTSGLKPDVSILLNEIIEKNNNTIFLNDETVKESVRHMAYVFKDSLSKIDFSTAFLALSDNPDNNEFVLCSQEEYKEKITNEFKKDMIEMFNENVDDILEKNGFDDCIEDIF